MKRNFEAGNRAVFGDILKATTLEQRAWIGAIVLAYNAAEGELHKLTGASLGIIGIGPPYSVTSRINGTDGLIGIIHGTVTAMALSAEHAKLFNTTLSGFAEFKGQRDAVIHAELSDTSTETGVAPGKRGKPSPASIIAGVNSISVSGAPADSLQSMAGEWYI